MAHYRLIGTYLDDLRGTMRWHRDADDIVAETSDHLRCAVERRIGDDRDSEAAQREVLEDFGQPADVARAFALTRSGRLALPNRLTRDTGVLALISAGLWIAFPAVWFSGGWLYDRLDAGGPADEVGSLPQLALVGVMAMTLLGAAATLLVTMLTLRERHGEFGSPGNVGIAATGFGCAAALFGWFFIGSGSLLIAGTALVAVDLWRRGIAPRGSALATGAGLAIGGLAWAVLRYIEIGSPDQHSNYPIAVAAGFTTGPIILAVGLIGIGRWLTNEEPIELGDPTQLAPV